MVYNHVEFSESQKVTHIHLAFERGFLIHSVADIVVDVVHVRRIKNYSRSS